MSRLFSILVAEVAADAEETYAELVEARAARSDAALFSRSSFAVSEKEDDLPCCIAAGVFGVVGLAEDARARGGKGGPGRRWCGRVRRRRSCERGAIAFLKHLWCPRVVRDENVTLP